jgi:tetratricopeptide (TPR) repeat protein
MWRAIAHDASDEFESGLEAYKRAHELDPLWPFPVRALIDANAEMGDRAAAEAVVREGLPDDPMTRHFALARIAVHFGDFSEAARRYAIVAKSPARWARPAQRSLGDIQFMLGLSKVMPAPTPVANVGSFNRYVPRVWMSPAPSSDEWQRRNRSPAAALVYNDENIVAAKLMLNAGRAPELVATFDGPTGLLGLRPGQPVGPCQFQEVPLVALALRAVGRNDEAEALLRQADERLRGVYRRGKVPVFIDADAAAVWAVHGKNTAALEVLRRAFDRGWTQSGRIDLTDLSNEPAFRSLRGDPRFKALLSRYEAHYSKERQETIRALRRPI